MQWKDVDHPTFTRMCKLAINWLDYSQWCIAKNGGGYTQRGVAKGLKVPCLFMITEVSIIRCQKNPEVGIRRIPAYTPQYTTDYSNSFSGIQMDCLWQTICILERQLLVSIRQNQHSSYSMSSSRNSDKSCHLGVWLFHDNAPAHKSLVAQQALCNWACSTKPSCLQPRLGSQ